MKKIILIIGLIIFGSCKMEPVDNSKTESVDSSTKFYTVEVEGCEYLYSKRAGYEMGYGFLAHKGNCKNSIHDCN